MQKYWLGFNHVKGIGANRLRGLWAFFQHDLEAAWFASASELESAGLDAATVEAVIQHRQTFDLDSALNRVHGLGAWLCTLDDNRYPPLLREIADAPPLLYVRGEVFPEDDRALAIVGTRKATTYGRKVTERIASAMADARVTVISGLAHGIDAAAHQAAVESGGRTIAVLGNGIETVYPSENRRLAEAIVEQGQGAIITEYPPGMPPHASNFPARNRIISGLSLGVLVVEAPENSGSLHTANSAAEQGREVFAIPGNISSPNSRGTNRLIQDGAKLVMHPNDILEELQVHHQAAETRQTVTEIAPENDMERRIIELITLEPLLVDDIAVRLDVDVKDVSAALLMMKLKGLVDETAPMMYMVSGV
jgi:DNA processing protein